MQEQNNLKAQSISQLTSIIRQDWPKPSMYAVQYLEAMSSINHIDDKYGAEDGRGIVTYFLSNASGWKGDVAKEVKAELKRRLKLQPGEIPLDEELIKKVSPVIHRVWEVIAADVIQCNRDAGDNKRMKNIEAIEVCLDAGYASMYAGAAGKEVDALISKLSQFHGYDKVQKFLSKHIQLDTY